VNITKDVNFDWSTVAYFLLFFDTNMHIRTATFWCSHNRFEL